jgi:hypothetical protein
MSTILEYEDLNEMVVNYLAATDYSKVAESIQQEIKSNFRLI